MTTYVLIDKTGAEVAYSEDYDRALRHFHTGTLGAVELARLDGETRVVLRRKTALSVACIEEEARATTPPKPKPEKAPPPPRELRTPKVKEPKPVRAKAPPRPPKPPREPRPRKPPPEPRAPRPRDPCKGCGGPVPHEDRRYRVFCSPMCKRNHDAAVNLAKQRARLAQAQARRACRHCGRKGLERGRRWYCSAACEREVLVTREAKRNHHRPR